MGFVQFVVLIAAMMALSALAIDSMLPALPVIGAALHVDEENRRQLVVTSYTLGFGIAQIFYGTLADRYGRRPVLLGGLVLYVGFSLLASLSSSFEMLLAARALQGIGAAATRVLPISIVRDCYAGRQMARVMSLTSLVFMSCPIMAPTIGQLILWVAPWQWEFGMLGVFGTLVLIWAALKLPETLHPEDRTPIELPQVLHSFKLVLTDRMGIGYTIATTFMMGAVLGFVNSAQQIFAEALHSAGLFTTIFAFIAGFIAVASLLNARLVNRLGTRIISHTALFAFIAIASLHAAIAWSGHETLVIFAGMQGLTMFCFGLCVGNFGAMAMENLGHVAGTASSVQGFFTMVVGSLIGFTTGQHFDGTAFPMILSYALCGVGALVVVTIAEGGRLFRPHQQGEGELHAIGFE